MPSAIPTRKGSELVSSPRYSSSSICVYPAEWKLSLDSGADTTPSTWPACASSKASVRHAPAAAPENAPVSPKRTSATSTPGGLSTGISSRDQLDRSTSSARLNATGAATTLAARRITAGSPITTGMNGSAGRLASTRLMSSGPTPPASPIVSAIRGCVAFIARAPPHKMPPGRPEAGLPSPLESYKPI